MVLKETLAYYTVDGGSAICIFLDATKAFGRVNYCKLFSVLMKRNISPMYLRLLLNMYTNSNARVSWNGVFSHSFKVENGVKQGGIVSSVLFCVYLDELLQRLHESGVGCNIGSVFVGALAYADDIALLAATPSAMRRLLKICDSLGTEFSVAFNASKSTCVVVSRRKYCFDGGLQFTIGSSQISVVNDYVHLGHHISANLDDKSDILSRSRSLCGKIITCYVSFRIVILL